MYYTVIKHSDHLRTLEKCRKHSPAARVFYISLVFSNARRVLSQCNTRLRLLYVLNIYYYSIFTSDEKLLFLDICYKFQIIFLHSVVEQWKRMGLRMVCFCYFGSFHLFSTEKPSTWLKWNLNGTLGVKTQQLISPFITYIPHSKINTSKFQFNLDYCQALYQEPQSDSGDCASTSGVWHWICIYVYMYTAKKKKRFLLSASFSGYKPSLTHLCNQKLSIL